MGTSGLPLGTSGGLRRPDVPKQLPTSCLRVRNPRFGRRLTRPAAAMALPEAPAGSWADVELRATSSGASVAASDQDQQPHRTTSAQHSTHQHSHQHSHQRQSHAVPQHEQQLLQRLRVQHQHQKHEAANLIVQRLMPSPAVASATQLPTRGGVSAGGVALGILLTVALQMVGRWLQRQRWAEQLMELLDLRRSSGRNASTSERDSGDEEDDVLGRDRRRRGDARGSDRTGDKGDGAAAAKSAFVSGGGSGLPGSLPGSPLSTLDGGAGSAGAAPQGQAGGAGGAGPGLLSASGSSGSLVPADPGESVEWVNMCWRKVWRVYQRGLERWIIDLLQPVFDGLVKDGAVPRWLCRLRVVELTLDHEAPYFSNMRRRNSRKDSDLNGVVDLRYTGGARMLLMLELGEGRWRFKVPVLVSDLDLECQMWLKLRLAPMCPWIGTISLAFVGPPNVKVQLSPYNRVRLMRVPVVQNYLRKLLTVDLPGLMVLPQRLEINIPPSVTTIAEAAVGRDTIMRAVASAVLQADAVEAALLAALPLGPQTPAGGVSLPEAFKGELGVTLREARNLPVWGFPGQSNPYCRLVLGDQAVQSRREGDTSHPGRHRAPVWNQEFQFLVEDPAVQVLEMLVKDSHLTGRTEVGRASIRLADVMALQHTAEGGKVSMWVPLQPPASSYTITGGETVPTGEVLVELSYKAFDDDEQDSGYREAENYFKQASAQAPITDIRSAAAASSRAAVAASAAVSAIAMTRAAAARAAARAARAAQEAAAAAAGAAKGAVDQGASIIGQSAGAGQGGGKGAAGDAAKGQQQQRGAQQKQPRPLLPPPADHAAAAPKAAASTERSPAGEDGEGHGPPAAASASSSGGRSAAVGAAQVGAAPGGNGTAAALGTPADDPMVVEEEELASRLVRALEMRASGKYTEEAVAAAAAAVAPATPSLAGARQAAAAATAVLDRPPAVTVEQAATGGGGEGPSNGLPYSHYAQNGTGNGGGEGRWTNGGSEDASDGHLAAPAPGGSLPGSAAAASGGYEAGSLSEASPVPGSESLGVAVVSSFEQEPRLRLEPGEVPSEGLAPLSHAQVVAEAPSVLPPRLEGAAAAAAGPQQPKELQVIDVVAEMAPGQEPGQRPRAGAEGSSSSGAGGAVGGGAAGGGAGGPVLSALASLGASAQSLTASALGKARESLTHRQPQGAQQAQQQAQGAQTSEEGQGQQAEGPNWLQIFVSKLPKYGGGSERAGGHQDLSDEGEAGAAAGAERTETSAAGSAPARSGAAEEHPWWQFWVPKDGAAKLRDGSAPGAESDGGPASPAADAASPAGSSDGGAEGSKGQPRGSASSKPWWQFWPDGDKDKDKDQDGKEREAEAGGSKPVEAIYIPPDLPLEEIAAEVQRLKEDSWRERSDHVSNLWMKAVERNDRKWLMLAAFLLSVAVGLLTVVAWRLEQLEHMQAVAPQVALMTMQAALQALEQHVSSGGGLGGIL